MRAYTSLLGHVFGSHPEINGYYELHQSYQTAEDLERQREQLAQSDGLKSTGRYLFDKLLHNDHTLNLALLEMADAVILIALRPPAATLTSILVLYGRTQPGDLYATQRGACSYYVDRLGALARFAKNHPGRYRYLDAPLVRDDTPRFLTTLGNWLGLQTPLSESYQTFTRTGVPGAGDSSEAISTGRILREKSMPNVSPLSANFLNKANQAYRRTRDILIANAADTILERKHLPGSSQLRD